jgi:hypothetical protein
MAVRQITNFGGMMKSSFVLLLAAIIVVVLSGLALGQDAFFPQYLEFNTLGGGARAAGMGGAFLGLSEGEYAYSWNPAGMVFAEKPTIGIQFNSASDKFSFVHISSSNTLSNYELFQAEAKRSHFNLDNSGFVVPFSFFDKQWAVGGGYRNIQDMEFKYETPGLFNSKDIFAEKDGIDAVSVAVSGKINENIGIGLTANDYIRGGDANQFSGKSIAYQSSPTADPDTVDIWDAYNTHYSGFNFDIGVEGFYSIFKGGIVIHTPYDLKQTVKLTENYMIPPVPVGYIYRYTATTSIPFSYSIGISAKPIEKLTFAADFDSRPMSKSRIDLNWELLSIQDRTINPNWEDLNQFRIGVEYKLDAGFAQVPLRVGFRNNPSVAKQLTAINEIQADSNTYTLNPVYGSQVNTSILTFGSGLHFQRAWVDIAYQFGSNSKSTEFDAIVHTSQSFDNKRDYSRLFVSAGMNF